MRNHLEGPRAEKAIYWPQPPTPTTPEPHPHKEGEVPRQ